MNPYAHPRFSNAATTTSTTTSTPSPSATALLVRNFLNRSSLLKHSVVAGTTARATVRTNPLAATTPNTMGIYATTPLPKPTATATAASIKPPRATTFMGRVPFLKKHARSSFRSRHADNVLHHNMDCAATVAVDDDGHTVVSKQPSLTTNTNANNNHVDSDDDDDYNDSDDDSVQNPAGKRQRRQAAATLVQNLPSWTGVGKKSKAQPRPQVTVPPRGIGPVAEPNHNDVLCGRGGRINSHEGNVQFRDIVNDTKKDYLAKSTKKLEKAHIAAGVVQQIRNMDPPGRFLKEDSDTGMWWDIGDAKAIKKVGQALREDAPDIREELDEEAHDDTANKDKSESSSGDNKKKADKSPASDKKVKSPKASAAQQPAKKHVIVLPTSRSSRRGEDMSDGALPPQSSLKQGQQPNGFQQVLPPSGASIASVSLPSMGPPQQPNTAGMMYPPSTSSNSSATLRHGQFSLRGQNTMSQKAAEMMNQQQQLQNTMMHNANAIFGRNFNPPSEMSLGSHGSSVSGLTGFTNSALMNETLLSGVSDGVSSLTAGDASFRMQQLMAAAAAGQPGATQSLANLSQAINNSQAQAAMNNANNLANLNNNMNNNNNNINSKNNMGPPAVGMFKNQNRGNNNNANNNNNLNLGSGNSVFSGGSRGSNGFNNYSLTSGGSVLSGQTMPQAAAIFGRTSSHNDVNSLLREDMSMAEHSLLGGGIRGGGGRDNSSFKQLNQQFQLQQQMLLQQQMQQQQEQQQHQEQQERQEHQVRQQLQQEEQRRQQQQQLQQQQFQQQQLQHFQQQQQQQQQQHQSALSHLDGMDGSILSGHSLSSRTRNSYKDGMDFSVFSGASLANSLANRSNRNMAAAYAPASARYGRSNASIADRSVADRSQYSISAMSQSIASMSLHSGGASVASFSAHSTMSDFSETLLALDLAGTQ